MQGPFILPFSLLNTFLSPVLTLGVKSRAIELHTNTHNPLGQRGASHLGAAARYAGPPQRYHVIPRECGSMPALRGHSEEQHAPPPSSSIVLLPWPLS